VSSSIHIQKSVGGSVGHNSRENFSYSVVYTDEKNECDTTQKDAYKTYRSELEIRSQKYTERTKQKLQKSTVTQLSAIVNLEQYHTLKDLEPIKKEIEKIFDTKVLQMAIHRDEGKLISKKDRTELYSGKDFFLNTKNDELYFDKKFTKKIDMSQYEIKKNYHAHIEMLGLDSDGQAIRQKMNKVALVQLQDFAADSLQMERGQKTKSYTKEQMREILNVVGNKNDYESTTLYAQKFNEVALDLGYFINKRKRKDTRPFKENGAERESAKRAELANTQDLKEGMTLLRSQLKEMGAERKDYAELEQLNKDLKEQIKAKSLTVEGLQDEIQDYKKTKNALEILQNEVLSVETPTQRLSICDMVDTSEKIKTIKKHINSLETSKIDLDVQILEKDKEIDSINDSSKYRGFLKRELNVDSIPEEKIGNLFGKIVKLLQGAWEKIKELTVDNAVLKEEIVTLETEVSTLKEEKSAKNVVDMLNDGTRLNTVPLPYNSKLDEDEDEYQAPSPRRRR